MPKLWRRQRIDAWRAERPPLITTRFTEALALAAPSDCALRRALLSNRSLAALKGGRAADALADAEAAAALSPDWAKGHWRRGRALAALGRCEPCWAAGLGGG
jgi:hypothetical protein